VHLGRGSILPAYIVIPCAFDDALVSRLDRKRLPKNWRSYPAPPELQLIGDEWVSRSASAVLEVPGAVIEADANYLLNPHHPHFRAVRVREPQRYEFDLRLLKP
jgi:RES domain-containing protein